MDTKLVLGLICTSLLLSFFFFGNPAIFSSVLAAKNQKLTRRKSLGGWTDCTNKSFSPLEEQIRNDLTPFDIGISRKELDAAQAINPSLVRVLIYDNALYINSTAVEFLKKLEDRKPHASIFILLKLLCR